MMTVPIIIDFQGSGFGSASYPIEVGFSGRHGEGWCSLIQPEAGWDQWDAEMAKRHAIRRETLVERGKPILYIAEQLNFFLNGRTVFSQFRHQDYIWMARIFTIAGVQPRFKLMDLCDIINHEQEIGWSVARAAVVKELGMPRNRASSRARILQLTWLRTYDASR